MARQLFTNTRAWLALTASLVVLNASLTFDNVWPTPTIRWANALSVELAACVLLLAAARGITERPPLRALAAIWVALVAGHYLDVTAPALYGREFNLYWDSAHLGNVAAMLARAVPWWLVAAVVGLAVLAAALAYVAARAAIGRVWAAMQHRPSRLVLGSLAGLAVAVFAGQQLSDRAPAETAFARPVTPAYVRQARYVVATIGPTAVTPPLGPSPPLDRALRGLGGADVLLIFLESYGAVTYDTPEIAAGVAAGRADLLAAIGETRRRVVSAYVESPTFGGSSWLAHLSLLSGVDVHDQYAYTSLMASRRDTLVTTFARRGYRTVALMPGMRQAWPEGAFYRFDAVYDRDRFEYQGPQFGWWSIPDQYALATLDGLERQRPLRAPLFVVFPTSTTHAPFGPVAPYQPDWPRVLTATPYDQADVERAMAATPDLTNLRPAYVRAMTYEYLSLAGYLRQQADDLLLIAIGDHQPPAAVSGPDAPWQVPVHVIGGRDHVLERLIEDGFQPGLEPRRPALGRMHALVPMLLDAFDALDDRADQ
ncbi:MAG: sulfatase-like hydrolase/transferase [Vicinamibacterales bacterium]